MPEDNKMEICELCHCVNDAKEMATISRGIMKVTFCKDCLADECETDLLLILRNLTIV